MSWRVVWSSVPGASPIASALRAGAASPRRAGRSSARAESRSCAHNGVDLEVDPLPIEDGDAVIRGGEDGVVQRLDLGERALEVGDPLFVYLPDDSGAIDVRLGHGLI